MATHNAAELRRAAGALAVAFDQVDPSMQAAPRASVFDYAA
jgi:hypothetical protein